MRLYTGEKERESLWLQMRIGCTLVTLNRYDSRFYADTSSQVGKSFTSYSMLNIVLLERTSNDVYIL